MPNRVLRDWTDSENIDQLDVHAERFFTRLIMKVDDYGRYTANVKLLKSQLFPLKSDIRETDITRWLAACKKSGLIALYAVANKEFLQIDNFKQTLRQKVEKYPPPALCDESATHLLSIQQAGAIPETKGNETKPEVEVEGNGGKPPTHTQTEIDFFKNFNEWIKVNAPRVNQLKNPFTIEEYLKIKQDFTLETIKKILIAMQNRNDLLKKYVSANLTFRNWASKEFESEKREVIPIGPSASELKANHILNQVD